ncbi:metalloendopeptidase [Coemansia spiralis]|uniref:Metalloendopeptidase n=2 Tax=Coemansia TaxID=4863 RepID=A0A9W8FZA1_9FUNG|nr:metalloendopeptidase [Coemansia sp. RSA 1358]KAJ2672531.1 metalloendopeptidase [Coemansia spiralis]
MADTKIASVLKESSVARYDTLEFYPSVASIQRKAHNAIHYEKRLFDAVATHIHPTFEDSIAMLGHHENSRSSDMCLIEFLQHVSTSKAVCDACSAAKQKLEAHETEMYMRSDVYRVVHAVHRNKEEMSKLSEEDRRLVEKLESRFRKHGVGLRSAERSRFNEITCRLYELEHEFNDNIASNKIKVLFSLKELDGLPTSFFKNRKVQVTEAGIMFVVSADDSDFTQIMQLANSSNTRKKMYNACKSMCPDNTGLLQKAVALRLEKAELLGFQTNSKSVLSELTAKSPQAVLGMLKEIKEKLHAPLSKRLAILADLKRGDLEAKGKLYDDLFIWDRCYYEARFKASTNDHSSSEISSYLPTEHVVDSVLDIYQRMLGLQIKKITEPTSVWHSDVKLYEAWEANGNSFVGSFYLDLYPRKGKYSETMVFSLRPGFAWPGKSREHPVAALIANFPKSTAKVPALLDHENLRAFMHEMAHVFQNVCSATKWSILHGTHVEEDFVEVPSRMMENWCWQPSVLRQVSAHYESGEPMPECLINSVLEGGKRDVLSIYLNALFLALYDMEINNSSNIVDVDREFNRLSREIVRIGYSNIDLCSAATASNFMADNDSRYYGYLWSEMYSHDMFESRFLNEGVDNEYTGWEFRKQILQPGGSRDSRVSVAKFLGRDPSTAAIVKQISQIC